MPRSGLPARKRLTLQDLVELGEVEVAVDTEFTGEETNTIQLATRSPTGQIIIQLYHAAKIPTLPRGFDLDSRWPQAERSSARWDGRIELRRARKITPDLSPAAMLRDLFQLRGLEPVSRSEGFRLLPHPRQLGDVPKIRLVLIGHYLPVDLLRMFGREFLQGVFTPEPGDVLPPPVGLQQNYGVGFTGNPGGSHHSVPIVQFARDSAGNLVAIELATIDTIRPFGTGSLDDLCRTFLGRGKIGDLTPAEKADMRALFRADPARAWAYAIADVVQTLQLLDAMRAEHRAIYQQFGFAPDKIPPMKYFQGARAAQLLEQLALRHAAGSAALANPASLQALMRKGGAARFGGEGGYSRLGGQTGHVPGGLLFSRTGDKLWHEAGEPDRFCDLDLRGCYNRVTQDMMLYCGRPVVYEPGDADKSLKTVVREIRPHCPPDGWFLRVSGTIGEGQNTLIPSTLDAVTYANYRQNRHRQPREDDEPARSRLFTREIRSGVVTADTWALIQLLPAALRRQYEALTVESCVLYPTRLIAADGSAFDALTQQLGTTVAGWRTEFEPQYNRLQITEVWSAADVALAVPLGGVTRRIAEFRREARGAEAGRGGREQVWKLLGNSLYGAIASPHFAVGNAVAANVITAAARAAAWAIFQALNGFQVVTDGCTYRRDQIPALSLAECLALQPDYQVRRAEVGGPIPFVPADEVPLADGEFQIWLRAHVRKFLGGAAGSPVDRFELEHKAYRGRTTFDALVCDGVANDIKLARSPRERRWIYLGSSRRGYSRRAKRRIARWAVRNLRHDRLRRLPPLSIDRQLLGVAEARLAARAILRRGAGGAVVVPLGYARKSLRRYRPVRLSAFLCETERQWKSLARRFDKFEGANGLGLEALAFRQRRGERRAGSLETLVAELAGYIRSGRTDLAARFHLDRPSAKIEALCRRARAVVAEGKERLARAWEGRVERPEARGELPPTGAWCRTLDDIPRS